MIILDELSMEYNDFIDGTYDCIDRFVLNAWYPLGQSPGGFRTWWWNLKGGDDGLNNTNLMRMAGRFSRRIRAYAKKYSIPVIYCKPGDRKHEIAEELIPNLPGYRGLFCILVGKAPGPVYKAKECKGGVPHLDKKFPFVNHYSFHIMDPDWGHITIKFCPHPPFYSQIMLNGHEYVAKQAIKEKIPFIKEGNCFTDVPNATDLAKVADTMKDPFFVGRIVEVCDRWIYSTCLCFALTLDEQKTSRFRYSYSVYQGEYSRNLLFSRGRVLDQVFESIIDRTRVQLNIKTVKTIFGYKHRPFKKDKNGKRPKFEVVVERPVYNLTIFKVNLGKLTVKIYSKGERVLRIEAVAHNVGELRCGRMIDNFPNIVAALQDMVEKFLRVLSFVDVSFIDSGKLDQWPLPSQVGAVRVGGVDVNKPRMRAVMRAVIELSINRSGFTAYDTAEKVREILKKPDYQPRHASYDLKKLRGKKLVHKIGNSRRYESTDVGLKSMSGFLTLRDKVIILLLSGAEILKTDSKPHNIYEIDARYRNIQREMQGVFNILKVAA